MRGWRKMILAGVLVGAGLGILLMIVGDNESPENDFLTRARGAGL